MTACRVVALLLVLASSACSRGAEPLPPVPTPAEARIDGQVRDFFDAVRPLVGKDPLECNSDLREWMVPRVGTAPPGAAARWFECAQGARAAKRPFLIVLEQPPFEGWHLTGAVGRADGSVRVFSYYEGCCWPPGDPSLEAGVCESPSARSDNGGLYGVRCANEPPNGIVPKPELWLRRSPLLGDLRDRLGALTGDDVIDCGLEVDRSNARPGFSSLLQPEMVERGLTADVRCAPRAGLPRR